MIISLLINKRHRQRPGVVEPRDLLVHNQVFIPVIRDTLLLREIPHHILVALELYFDFAGFEVFDLVRAGVVGFVFERDFFS